ETTASRVEDP
ncbi:hypothetical protein ACHAW5_001805, partial [Stephanodiscus triporus]